MNYHFFQLFSLFFINAIFLLTITISTVEEVRIELKPKMEVNISRPCDSVQDYKDCLNVKEHYTLLREQVAEYNRIKQKYQELEEELSQAKKITEFAEQQAKLNALLIKIRQLKIRYIINKNKFKERLDRWNVVYQECVKRCLWKIWNV